LVDPIGHLFWSHGVDCVGEPGTTPVEERDNWFANPPFAQFPELAGKHYALKGYYAGREVNCFNFAAANLLRKFGDDWERQSATLAHQRLRSWGLNTIGNWSDSRLGAAHRTPYTATLGVRSKQLAGSTGYWGKFADVFDPSFA